MGLVSTWLNGIGLSSAVSTFQAAGIVTPAALAELDVAHFEALGISDPDDRRKLFYLVQRIKMAVKKDKSPQKEDSVERQVDAVISGTISATSGGDSSSGQATTEANGHNHNVVTDDEPQEGRRRSRRIASKQNSMKENQKQKQNGSAKTANLQSPQIEVRSSATTTHTDDRSPPRQNRRVEEKISPKANAVFNLEDDDNDDDDDDKMRRTDAGRVSDTSKTSITRKKSGLKKPNIISASSSFSDDAEAVSDISETKPIMTPTSKMQGPKTTRRLESKLQNPGTSMRTGKTLSAIPAESIAPMSPLVDLSTARMEEEVKKGQRDTTARNKSNHQRDHSGDSLDDLLQSSTSECDLESVGEMSDTESDTVPKLKLSRRPKSMGASGSKRTPGLPKTARPSDGQTRDNGELDSFMNSSNRKSFNGRSDSSIKSSSTSSKKKAPFVHGGTESESWATKVSYLREDNDAEHEMFCDQADQQLYDYDMSIRVIVRKRPVSKSEASRSGGIDVVHPLDYGDYGRLMVYQPKTRVDLTKEIETVSFAYDNIFDEASTNVQIYRRSLRGLIQPFFKGQWATVFAYGQTGSGKTYTMMGSNMTGINAGTDSYDEANLGLYYLAALDIFDMVKRPEYSHLSVQVSLFEIYGGKLFDLLHSRKQIKCLEDSRGKVCFPGLTEHPVQGPDRLMELIEEGALNRSTGTTSRNADSSRSHAVLQLKLRKDVGRRRNVEHGRLNFIDLAGSERGADTSSCSRATRLEGAEINTSLLALKEVIRALATGGSMTHIPFRGSKLTQVLKDSFVGENSRCCMIACISPDIGNCEQTLNTLRYADRVKERDSESGALASSYEQPTRLAPIQMEEDESEPQSSFSEEAIPGAFASSNIKDTDEAEEDDVSVDKTYQSDADTAALDDLLEASLHETPQFVGPSGPATPIASSIKHKAGEDLVTAHRAVMSSMLTMVKDEMTLVNQVDADRDGLDDYIAHLEKIQSTQLNLISDLRNSLHNYVSAVEGPHSSPKNADSDEESFEDLRD